MKGSEVFCLGKKGNFGLKKNKGYVMVVAIKIRFFLF